MFSFLRRKKVKVSDEVLLDLREDLVLEYENSINRIREMLSLANSEQERRTLYESITKIIRNDLQYDHISKILYADKRPSDEFYLLPSFYVNEKGVKVNVLDGVEARMVDLTETSIVTTPWAKQRFVDQLLNFREKPFAYDKENHDAYYYEGFGICYIKNGNHSVGAGIVHGKGEVPAKVVDVHEIINHVHTDGKYWYNSHTNKKFEKKVSGKYYEVFDFRIAILFTMLQDMEQGHWES